MSPPSLCRPVTVSSPALICEAVAESEPPAFNQSSEERWRAQGDCLASLLGRFSAPTSTLWSRGPRVEMAGENVEGGNTASWTRGMAQALRQLGPLLFGGALFLLPAGCSSSSSRQASESESETEEIPNLTPPLELRRETQLEGAPRAGTVLWLGQQHALPEAMEEHMPRDPVQRLAFIEATARNQFAALQTLENEGVTHLFVEGFSEAEEVAAVRAARGPDGREYRELFRRMPRRFEDLNLEQRLALFHYGAEQIYLILHDNVHLHGAATPNHHEENVARMQELMARHRRGEDIAAALEAFDESRETYAALRVTEFLSSHPEERVALIFGSDHDFADNFTAIENPPRLVSYRWEPRRD